MSRVYFTLFCSLLLYRRHIAAQAADNTDIDSSAARAVLRVSQSVSVTNESDATPHTDSLTRTHYV